MKFTDNTFIKIQGVYYPQILNTVKKSSNPMQPIFEAFTNSLEAIDLIKNKQEKGSITISCYFNKDAFKGIEFSKIIIEDTGKGFDNKEFERFLTFADTRKGYNNKGSGRLQLVHYFDNCEFVSIFKEKDVFKQRTFKISKSSKYINPPNNTITFLNKTEDVTAKKTGTILTLRNLISKTDEQFYKFQASELKEKLVNHYIQYFCLNRKNLPNIKIIQFIDNVFDNEVTITSSDIPEIDKTFNFNVNYNRLALDGKSIEKLNTNEEFTITSFKINKNNFSENVIKLTSKDEVVELDKHKINLTCISSKDYVENDRFLFLISSKYLNEKDGDIRGELNIPTKETFKDAVGLFQSEEIFLEDIEIKANDSIINEYTEVQAKNDEKREKIEELKSMFLLNDEFLSSISISLNDTEESILQKVYIAESKQEAKIDSNIKNQIEQLDTLDPTSKNYEDEFNEYIDKLVKEIPLQNRKALTHYVARRRLVLELFDKILGKKLEVQNNGSRKKNEALIHNLIFKQKSTNPDTSDLWLLNEDFILFKGSSEYELKDLKIDNINIFKDNSELTEVEVNFKYSLEENRDKKRPDVLLFPEEGKCIIIEFKDPDVNVSDYLTQIQNYATLIRNYTKNEFQFDTFYAYLLGEKIHPFDVISKDPNFKEAYNFDYVYRPSQAVSGLISNRKDGSIYTEVIKYSTLLARAKNRNDVFIKKLTDKNISSFQNFDSNDLEDN